MTIQIDPVFAAYLPLIAYLTGGYIALMVGQGMAARRALKANKKG